MTMAMPAIARVNNPEFFVVLILITKAPPSSLPTVLP